MKVKDFIDGYKVIDPNVVSKMYSVIRCVVPEDMGGFVCSYVASADPEDMQVNIDYVVGATGGAQLFRYKRNPTSRVPIDPFFPKEALDRAGYMNFGDLLSLKTPIKVPSLMEVLVYSLLEKTIETGDGSMKMDERCASDEELQKLVNKLENFEF